MKNILWIFLAAFITILAPSCSQKSGCPAETAQSQVDKNGEFKSSKTTSGLLPPKKNYKKEKGRYKPKHKVKHSN